MSQRIIGITGGIATGKTTVSNYLANNYNIPILDADIYARSAVALGTPILAKIQTRYGQEILLENGNLNRTKLGEIIFNNTEEKQWLENQIHPYVRHQILTKIQQLSNQTIGLAVPLLFEANMTDLCTEIWVIYCYPEQQKQRLIQRDHLTPEQAQARINSQMSLEKKCQQADKIINNSFTLENLLQQIDTALL